MLSALGDVQMVATLCSQACPPYTPGHPTQPGAQALMATVAAPPPASAPQGPQHSASAAAATGCAAFEYICPFMKDREEDIIVTALSTL